MPSLAVDTPMWPAMDELKDVSAAFSPALDAIERIAERYDELVDTTSAPSYREGVDAPTSADVGALIVMLEDLKLTVGLVTDKIRRLEAIARSAALDVEYPDA